MSFVWTYFWDIKWIFLVLLFILFSFFFELKSSSLNSICLMLFLFVLISIDISLFNFDSFLGNNNVLVIFLLSFIMLFVSIYFWQIFFSKMNQKMEFSTLVLLIFVLGFFIFKSENMLELFLVIEGLSFSAYILAGFEKDTKMSSSVGIQYLILGSISSVFLMIAFLLVYNQFGSGVFTNLFLANLDFLQEYFFINDNIGLETFLTENKFNEEPIYWSLGLLGVFSSKKWKDLLLFLYYSIRNSIVSIIVLNIFYPNLVKEFTMKVEDFNYLSKNDFNDVTVICGPLENPSDYVSISGNTSLNTIKVPRRPKGFDMIIYKDENYTALTGMSAPDADLVARKQELPKIKNLLKKIYKIMENEAKIEKKEVDMEEFFKKVEGLRDCTVLPQRWRFENDSIQNWGRVAQIFRNRYKNDPPKPINDFIDDLAEFAYKIRQFNLIWNLDEHSVLVYDDKTHKWDFNFEGLDNETSSICEDWDLAVAAYMMRDSATHPTFSKYTKHYLPGTWFESVESTTKFAKNFRPEIYLNNMPLSEYGPGSEQTVAYTFVDGKAYPSGSEPVESNIFGASIPDLDLSHFDFSIYGTILIVIGFLIGTLLYKIKGAPFHIWAPTIYTRMPTASLVTLMTLFTFIFSLYFFQLFLNIFYLYGNIIAQLFLMSGLLSLLFGFLGAFDQKLLKKFFVYSSIGHVAFLLFTFTFFSSIKSELSLLMYLFIYLISTFLLWYLITFNSQKIEFLSNLLKPVKNNNLFIFIFIIITFSMSGIPPLAGFYIKFDILNLLAFSQEFFVLFTSLLITVASFYYYLRLLKIANFENFTTSLISTLKVEKSWSFLRLFFLFLSTFLLFLFSVVIEQSFYYFNSYLF